MLRKNMIQLHSIETFMHQRVSPDARKVAEKTISMEFAKTYTETVCSMNLDKFIISLYFDKLLSGKKTFISSSVR